MPDRYSALSRDTEKLLLAINKIYKENDFDVAETNAVFTKLYLHNPTYSRERLYEQIQMLIKLGYLANEYDMQPSELGFHYRYFQYLSWKHRCIVPASVSLFVAILANAIIHFLGLK